MSREKLKNLIILILVLVNLFLLALVVPQRMEDRRLQQQTHEALSDLYAQAGVTLPWQQIPETAAAVTLQLPVPDVFPCLAVLLGEQVLANTDGTVTSSKGRAAVSDGGRISVTLTDSEPVADKEAYVRSLLEDMEVGFSALTSEGDSVTATLTAEDLPLLTECMTFTFQNDRLVQCQGLPAGKNAATAVGGENGVSAADALMAFLRSRLDTGWMGSSVLSVTQGYDCAPDAARQVWVLTPAWQIRTDSGDYLVDALTCSVKNVTQM